MHQASIMRVVPDWPLPLFHVYTILSLTVQDGYSPLYAASENGHTEIVDLLVRAGADVNQATTQVYTCIRTCTCSLAHDLDMLTLLSV